MLEGLKIIEIEGIGPGPFAAMSLADMGAEVIVVQRASPPLPGMPDQNIINRGKKSIVLDLKQAKDLEVLQKVIKTADGLIEGFRPGVMEKLNLGPEHVHPLNPRLVYGRMTGWGQTGPRAREAGHDLNYLALSGALWYASPAGIPPMPPPTMLGDVGGGAMYLVAGMLAGLIRAQKTGQGTVVDAAIVDGSAHMMNLIMSMRQSGVFPEKRGQGLLDGPHWTRCYACSDEAWISVQCLEPHFYAVFLETLGLANDPEFQQQHNPGLWLSLAGRLSEIFAQHPARHWSELFSGTDACVAVVNSPSNAADDPHMVARGIWDQVDGHLQARAAPRFDGTSPDTPSRGPKRGEHTDEILSQL